MVDIHKIDEFFNGQRPFSEQLNTKVSTRIRLLRVAKLVLPSVAAIIIALIMIFPTFKKETVTIMDEITIPKEGELEKLHIEKTVFSITGEENQISKITADSIDEITPGSKLVKIIHPKGNLPIGKKGEQVDLEAKVGYYNQNEAHIKVENDVKAVYMDGTTVLTQSAEYEFNNSFAYGNDDIYAFGDWGKLKSESFEYYQKNELLVLNGHSKVFSDGKILISDKQIKYYRLENRVEALGNVKVETEGNILYADIVKADLLAGREFNIKKVEAFGNVKVVTKDGIAKGNYAIYEPQKYQIILLDNVSIEKDGNIIYGQKAVTDLKTSVSKIIADSKTKKRVSGIIKGSTIKEK